MERNNVLRFLLCGGGGGTIILTILSLQIYVLSVSLHLDVYFISVLVFSIKIVHIILLDECISFVSELL